MTDLNTLPAADNPLLDNSYLSELNRHLGPEIAIDLLADGVLALTDRVGSLAQAVQNAEDPEGALARLAHDIVGTAGQLGLHRLVHAARQLERKAIARAETGIEQRNLAVLTDQSLAALTAYLVQLQQDTDIGTKPAPRRVRIA